MHMKLDCNDDGVPNAETDSAFVNHFVVDTASEHHGSLDLSRCPDVCGPAHAPSRSNYSAHA